MLLLLVCSTFFYLEYYNTHKAKIVYGGALAIIFVLIIMDQNIWIKKYQNIIDILLSLPLFIFTIYKKSKEIRNK